MTQGPGRDPDCAGALRRLARELTQGRTHFPPPGPQAQSLARCLEKAAQALDPDPPQAQPASQAAPDQAPDQGPDQALLHCDGAARGNPGPAGAGALLSRADGSPLARLSRYLGTATNNQAEYQALLLGLEEARRRRVRRLTVRLDSELVVKQLNGTYRVKNPQLRELYQKARSLLRGFERVDIIHIKREHNAEADQLANQAIDQAGR